MSRPRQKGRKHWPDYLGSRTTSKGQAYFWKHPKTGKEYSLGYDFADAAAQAREANLKIAIEAQANKVRLADRIDEKDKYTMDAWLDMFDGILSKRKSKKRGGGDRADGTVRRDKRWIEAMRKHFDNKLIEKIDTRECAELLQTYIDAGKEQTAYNLKSFMVDCFSEAEGKGWIKRGTNPAELLKVDKPETKRQRLSMEQFMTILETARKDGPPWLELAMQFGLLTGQRVGDIAAMRFDAVFDGHLHVQQIKYNYRVRIPVELGIPAIGMTIDQAITQARRKGIVGAKHIIHQRVQTGRSSPGEALNEATISRAFTQALRDTYDTPAKLQKEWPGGKPPTFHELRALAKSIYKAQGIDTLALLGHEHESTAAIYSDPRAGWTTVTSTGTQGR